MLFLLNNFKLSSKLTACHKSTPKKVWNAIFTPIYKWRVLLYPWKMLGQKNTGMLKKYGRGTCRLDRAQKMQEIWQKHGERHFSHRKQYAQRQSQERVWCCSVSRGGKAGYQGRSVRKYNFGARQKPEDGALLRHDRSVDFITKVMRKHSMIVTKGVAQQKLCFRKITSAAVGKAETLTFPCPPGQPHAPTFWLSMSRHLGIFILICLPEQSDASGPLIQRYAELKWRHKKLPTSSS